MSCPARMAASVVALSAVWLGADRADSCATQDSASVSTVAASWARIRSSSCAGSSDRTTGEGETEAVSVDALLVDAAGAGPAPAEPDVPVICATPMTPPRATAAIAAQAATRVPPRRLLEGPG